jgi:hypothetical protein
MIFERYFGMNFYVIAFNNRLGVGYLEQLIGTFGRF